MALLRSLPLLLFIHAASALLNVRRENTYVADNTCPLLDVKPQDTALPPHASVTLAEVDDSKLVISCTQANGSAAGFGKDLFLAEVKSPESFTRLKGRHLFQGYYDFPGWKQLPPGHWLIEIYLWVSPNPGGVLNTTGIPAVEVTAINDTFSGMTINPEDRGAVYMRKYSDLNVLLTCNRTRMLELSYKKGGSELVDKPRCTFPAKGVWVNTTSCQEGKYCTGDMAQALVLSTGINLGRRFHHVYVPHTCKYHMYSPQEAMTCLQGKKLAFIGDSVMKGLVEAIRSFLPQPGNVSFWELLPFRFGVRIALRNVKQFTSLVSGSDYLFFNSMLHDISNFREHKIFYGNKLHTELLTPYNMTEILYKHRRLDGRYEYEKHLPAKQYMEATKQLVDVVKANKRQNTSFFWLFDGGRITHSRDDCDQPNQTERLLCLQHLILPLVQKEFEPVDFTFHGQDAHGSWYDDLVHYGKDHRAGVQRMSLHILLNMLCEPPPQKP